MYEKRQLFQNKIHLFDFRARFCFYSFTWSGWSYRVIIILYSCVRNTRVYTVFGNIWFLKKSSTMIVLKRIFCHEENIYGRRMLQKKHWPLEIFILLMILPSRIYTSSTRVTGRNDGFYLKIVQKEVCVCLYTDPFFYIYSTMVNIILRAFLLEYYRA